MNSKRGRIVIVAFSWASVAFLWKIGVSSAQQVEIVVDGKPRAAIVLAEKATIPAKVAAYEFRHYVRKITGAKLPLVTDNKEILSERDEKYFVLVGESKLTKKVGLKNSDFQKQEYLIRTQDNYLIFIGRDEEEYGGAVYYGNRLFPNRGTGGVFKAFGSMYAVDDFLEQELGLRWYLPGDIGEVCPEQSDIVVEDINLRKKPWTRYRFTSRMSQREPFHYYGYAEPDRLVRAQHRDMALWQLRMKIGGDYYACNHSFYGYYERFGKEHPEWWKEGKPTRIYPHPDYTNPDLIKQAAKDAIEYFRTGKKYKGAGAAGDYFAVMPNDGRKNLIWSEEAEKLRNTNPAVQKGFSCGWASDYVFHVVNEVARIVRKQFPGRWISCAAYAAYFNPPRKITKLAPNISIMHCGWLHRAFKPEEFQYHVKNLEAWSKLTRELYVWEYYQTQGFGKFKIFPVVYPHQIGRAIKEFKRAGIKGMFFEATGAPVNGGPFTDGALANPAEDILNHYITWKYLCDTSRSVDEILDEHYRLFYGPAEKQMKRFFTLIEKRWSDPKVWRKEIPDKRIRMQKLSWEFLCPKHVLKKFEKIIRSALSLELSEPYKTRVRLVYEAIYLQMEKKAMEYYGRNRSRLRISCPFTTVSPKIDGIMEKTWEKSAESKAFVSPINLSASIKTSFRAMRDNENIYFYIDCEEPDMSKLKFEERKQDDKGIANDDHIEIAIDIGRTRSDYYSLLFNALGNRCDRIVKDNKKNPSWDSRAQVSARKYEKGWALEISIPLDKLGAGEIKKREVWGINVARFRPHISAYGWEPRTTFWSPTFGAFGRPNEFGVLEMIPEGPIS